MRADLFDRGVRGIRKMTARAQLSLLIFLTALWVYSLTQFTPVPISEHVLQAQAILHGHFWVDAPVHESVIFRGYRYLLHPPGSALAILPLVLLHVPAQHFASLLFGALSVTLAWLYLTARCGYRVGAWLTAFFALGTVFWFETVEGMPWGFALCLSTVPTWLALMEVDNERSVDGSGCGAGAGVLGAGRPFL